MGGGQCLFQGFARRMETGAVTALGIRTISTVGAQYKATFHAGHAIITILLLQRVSGIKYFIRWYNWDKKGKEREHCRASGPAVC